MDSATDHKQPTRRLSAVMFTDMVGYSKLVERDERIGLQLLAEQREIVRSVVDRFGGRVVDTAGDAFFVEFNSALEATECAVEIQQTLHERNEGVPSEQAIVLRIGLHLGDVIHVGGQVQGDGVNIAARMEPLAKPGSICISEDVARQVYNKISLPVARIGSRRLKNIRLPMEAYRVVFPWEDDPGGAPPFQVVTNGRGQDDPDFRRPIRIVTLIALTVGLSWFASSRLWPWEEVPSDDLSSSLVAVLPFSVQGSPEFAYLGQGMVDLLSTKLDGAGALQAVDPRAILGLVTQQGDPVLDPDGARAIAHRLGAGTFVMGNIVEVGGKLRIDAAFYSDDGAPGEQGTVEGSASEIFDLLDRLAAQLVVERGRAGVPLERLEAMTTSSFSALKHYLQGVDAFRSARFQTAADELSQAVQIDSTFALAWYQLSATADWLFDPMRALAAARQASRYADRLSVRGQRLVQALEAIKSGRSAEAFRSYRDFLTSYPDDVDAWYQLGELVFHAGPSIGVSPVESLEAWNRLLFFEPDQITALIHMARVFSLMGDRARVDSIATVIFELEPEAERNAELQAHVAFNSGDPVAIQEVVRLLDGVSDDMLMEVLWSVTAFRDDLTPAMTISPVLTEPTRSEHVRSTAYIALAYLHAAGGRFQSAASALDRASELASFEVPAHRAFLQLVPFRSISPVQLDETGDALASWDASSIPPYDYSGPWYASHDGIQVYLKDYLLGIVSARRGDVPAAVASAIRLDTAIAPIRAGSIVRDLSYGIRGQIALSRRDTLEAGRALDRAKRHASYQYIVNSPFFSQSRERFMQGLIFESLGDARAAHHALSFFRGLSIYDWVFVAPSHERRAALCREAADPRCELEHLRRFTEIWANADPEFQPRVQAALGRIKVLSRAPA